MQSPSGPKVYPKCACVHAHGDAAADVNVVDGQRGATPAHLAAKGGHGEALKLVVAAGADVNGKDKVSASGSVQRMLCCRRVCECVAGETCWGVSVVDAHTSQQQHSADGPLFACARVTCILCRLPACFFWRSAGEEDALALSRHRGLRGGVQGALGAWGRSECAGSGDEGAGGMGEHGCTLTTRHVCAREHVHVYTHMVTEQRM